MHELQLEVTYSFIADNSTESQRTFRLSVLSFAWHVASPAAGYGGDGRCAVFLYLLPFVYLHFTLLTGQGHNVQF